MKNVLSTQTTHPRETAMSDPVNCYIASNKPLHIEWTFPAGPDAASRTGGSTEFGQPALGPSNLGEKVFGSMEWRIFEDGTCVAKGQRRAGQSLVPLDSIKTGYLRVFVEELEPLAQ
jgi:hypothetical protein